jgi:hypothetical protein
VVLYVVVCVLGLVLFVLMSGDGPVSSLVAVFCWYNGRFPFHTLFLHVPLNCELGNPQTLLCTCLHRTQWSSVDQDRSCQS